MKIVFLEHVQSTYKQMWLQWKFSIFSMIPEINQFDKFNRFFKLSENLKNWPI